jgi:hypothetical protein
LQALPDAGAARTLPRRAAGEIHGARRPDEYIARMRSNPEATVACGPDHQGPKWALKNNLPDDTAMTVPSNPNKIGEKTSMFGKTGTLFLSAP